MLHSKSLPESKIRSSPPASCSRGPGPARRHCIRSDSINEHVCFLRSRHGGHGYRRNDFELGGSGWSACLPAQHQHSRTRRSKQQHICNCTAAGSTAPSTSSSSPSLEPFQELCEKHLGCRLAEDKLTDTAREQILAAPLYALDQGLEESVNTFGGDVTAAWACIAPLLLLRPLDAKLKQVGFLASLLSFPPEAVVLIAAEFPEWMLTPTDDLQHAYDELQEQFGLDALGMTRVLGTSPSLLATPLWQVRDNLYALSERLGVSLGVMNKAAAQFPALMLLGMQQLDAKLERLAEGFEMSAQDVLRMLSAAPQLVAASTEEVLSEWEALKQLVVETPAWLRQLSTLPPHVLGACLSNREFKLRMLYFYETGQLKVRYINIMSILRQEDVDFAQKYRGYIQWLREKSAQAEQAADMAVQ